MRGYSGSSYKLGKLWEDGKLDARTLEILCQGSRLVVSSDGVVALDVRTEWKFASGEPRISFVHRGEFTLLKLERMSLAR